MKNTYVKSLKEYEGPMQFDMDSLFAALKRVKGRRKLTSVADVICSNIGTHYKFADGQAHNRAR